MSSWTAVLAPLLKEVQLCFPFATRRRSGFTLIELLVVIAVIAILVGLLLPAVQKVRESSNRTQCANNLKQVGIALHGYTNDWNTFPTACTPPSYSSPPATYHGWPVRILPYLERNDLYSSYNFNVDWFDPSNATVIATPVKVFLCPSTPTSTAQMIVPLATTVTQASPASANQGTVPPWSAARWDYTNTGGLFSVLYMTPPLITMPLGFNPGNPNTPYMPASGIIGSTVVRFTDVRDGLSRTLMVSEDAGYPDNWQMGQLVTPASFAWPDDSNASGAWASAGLSPNDPQGGKGWSFDGATSPRPSSQNNCWPAWGFNQCSGTCALNCTNDMELYSFHPNGVNGLMGDGSVRFLVNNITLSTMAALITYSGQEVIPPDSY